MGILCRGGRVCRRKRIPGRGVVAVWGRSCGIGIDRGDGKEWDVSTDPW